MAIICIILSSLTAQAVSRICWLVYVRMCVVEHYLARIDLTKTYARLWVFICPNPVANAG